MRWRPLLAWATVGLLALAASALAQTTALPELKIGYLDRKDDPAYREAPGYAGVFRRERVSPWAAAELAIKDGAAAARASGFQLALVRRSLGDSEDAGTAAEALVRDGVSAIVLDLPLGDMQRVARQRAGSSVALLNARHRDDDLRLAACRTTLLHTMPSWAMLTDGLAQGLMALDWRRVLVLKGPAEGDTIFADRFLASARKFGLKIAEVRAFVLGNDPRNRAQINVRLLTGGADYDSVVVADLSGDFGRFVPYATTRARPVVGTTGLQPLAWHPFWERHGAPQLNRRFHRATGRTMSEEDWATWVAVRAIIDAAVAARERTPALILVSLMNPDLRIELYKALPGSFRPWSRQLRQSILLATHDAVVTLAPVEGVLHERNTLDTLGPDEPEFKCPP